MQPALLQSGGSQCSEIKLLLMVDSFSSIRGGDWIVAFEK
jgi:hypothetical protein